MNLFYSLSNNLIQHIYEYDMTHRRVYDLVMLELIIIYNQMQRIKELMYRHYRFNRTFFAFVEMEMQPD